MTITRRIGFGLSRELWLIEAGIFLNMLGYGAVLAVSVHGRALDQTYGALGMYVAEREIGVDGPIRENYLVTAFDTDDASRHVTEVCWPGFQTTPAGTSDAAGAEDDPGSMAEFDGG